MSEEDYIKAVQMAVRAVEAERDKVPSDQEMMNKTWHTLKKMGVPHDPE